MKTYRVVGNELDQEVLKYQRHNPGVAYDQALSVVMADHPDLAREYVAEFGHLSKTTVRKFGIEDAGLEDSSSINAGKQIDDLVIAWLRDHPQAKYSDGLAVILARHPDLKMLWTKTTEPDSVRNGKPWSPPGYTAFDDNADGDKKNAAAVDALVKKIQTEHPDWTLEQCLGEARARLKKKGAKLAELSEEVENARDRARLLLAA